jgi:hypothetical protein
MERIFVDMPASVRIGDYLGVYPRNPDGYIQLEFQRGRRLIWVMWHEDMSEESSVAIANGMLPKAWEMMPEIVRFAESESRKELPEFWARHDASGISGERLDTWSISLFPDRLESQYDVGQNYDFFEKSNLPDDLPEYDVGLDYSGLLCVRRTATGELCIL